MKIYKNKPFWVRKCAFAHIRAHEGKTETEVIMESEKKIEQKLCSEVKKRGGMAVKFVSPGLDGVPDRLVLFQGGVSAFVELKAPGRKMRPLQERRTYYL